MSKYRVTGPDGASYDITAPEGATEAQVLEYAKSQFSKPQAAAPAQPEPSFLSGMAQMGGDLLKGGAVGAAEIGQALLSLPKTLTGGLLPPIGGQAFMDRSRAATRDMYNEAGPAAGVGKFATQVAGTAGVGGPMAQVLGRGAQALPRVAGVLKSAPVTAAAEGAAVGLATDPDGGLGAAGAGAAGGVGGHYLLGGLARRLGSPVRMSQAAEDLRAQGVHVTAGQGGGRLIQNVEQAASYVPLVSAGVQKQRSRPYEQLREVVLEKAQVPNMPPVVVKGRPVDDVLEELRNNFDTAYAQISAGKFFQQDAKLAQDITGIVQDPARYLSEEQRRMLARTIKATLWDHVQGGGWAGDMLALAQNQFRQQAAKLIRGNATNAEREMAQTLRDISDSIRDMMARQDPTVKTLYDQLRVPYSNLTTAERAAGGALAQGAFTPSQLARAGGAKGNTDLEDLGRLAYTSLPRGVESPTPLGSALGAGALAGGGYLAGSDNLPSAIAGPVAALMLLGTRPGQRFMTGDYAAQRRLAELLRKHPNTGVATGAITATELGD